MPGTGHVDSDGCCFNHYTVDFNDSNTISNLWVTDIDEDPHGNLCIGTHGGGLNFDTGESELKHESERAIAEIAKLLKSAPGLKLYVVGHTDNVGGLVSNMKLSRSRADAVVEAFVRTHGIEASRLKSFGDGPYPPVASCRHNRTQTQQ